MVFRIARLFTGLVLISLAIIGKAQAAPLSPQIFAKNAEFSALKLSPDGKYAGALVPDEKHNSLVVIRLADSTLVGRVRLESDNHIANYWWASDTRLVVALALQAGALDSPGLTGELAAVDFDGGRFKYLSGWRGAQGGLGTRIKHDTYTPAAAFMLDPLVDDPNFILITSTNYTLRFEAKEVVLRMNIYTGETTQIDIAPAPGPARFILDPENQPRYVEIRDREISFKTYQRLPGQTAWQPYTIPGTKNAGVEPLAFSRDGKSVFLASHEFGPRVCLAQHFLDTGERRKLACDDHADLADVIYSFGLRGEPIAAVFAAGKPEIRILNTSDPYAQTLKMLLEAFPGKHIQPTTSSRDGKKVLVFVSDDRTPGDYYLFDTETRKADYFRGVREWLDPEQMSERRPIQLKARDGLPLWGYLTLPQGAQPKKLPLVVFPHGGPFNLRDDWDFDLEAQMMANHGYAVLQVNFRGSSGYGEEFIRAGFKAWGTTMIDDLTDAVHWTIDEGFSDPARICIYGASYGGFAALMSAVREPDLYRCAVGYAGIYDLKQLKKDADFTKRTSGKEYFSEAIAGTDEEMAAQSPITYLDRLKANVLIVHGEEDFRAPYSQAKLLKKALEAKHLRYEWLVKAGEGHGFWKRQNVEAFNSTLLDFLDRNIGAAATVKPVETQVSAP
jgi:dipeptidyl aminopeptidase/acylaminoacyl peptidase